MSKKTGMVAIILSIVSLCVSIAGIGMNMGSGNNGSAQEEGGSPQYVMYVGTNDKDTYQPEHTKKEAREIVDKICLKYFEGYTLQEATGSWTDDKDNVTHEYTIVCYFDDADKQTVYQAADEVIKELNQNTVLIEEGEVKIEYYSGK